MLLSAGDKLGPYEILSPLGAGGMGEVYQARDPRLGRDVAIKISVKRFSERFEHEARTIAQLNHSHICQIYDVGPNYLVMELVNGTPLKGPLSLEKTVEYATQILNALDAAHQKGIIHRDLKPANILVTKQGIKLLDFGLAKQASRTTEDDVTRALTDEGKIVGTLQYMSPEQLQSKEVDARSDLFSFGCVLYELLTGKRAFDGANKVSMIAAILEREPAALEVGRPLDRIVRRSLAKDPDQRFQTARDLKAALSWALEQPPPARPPQRRNLFWFVATAVLGVTALSAGWGWWRATRPAEHPLLRLSVDLGTDAVAGEFVPASISPDGTRLVYQVKGPAGKPMLASRLLRDPKAVVLPGTEDGQDPFFSSDGQWVGFFADRKMKKISVQGGAPVVLCDAPDARGASWGPDGNIFVALNTQGGLSRLASGGGSPQPVTTLQGDGLSHRWPQVLPGTDSVLFTLSSSTVAFEDASIAAVSLKTGEIKTLMRGGYFGRYLPTSDTMGHLVYVHEGVLFGIPFDARKLALHGTPAPLLDDLAADPNSGAGQFAFSARPSTPGILVYRSGKVSIQKWPVSWLDSSGKIQPLIQAPGTYLHPRFSPDGQRLALVQGAGSDGHIYVYDWRRDTMSALADHAQQPGYPTWTPDGKHIAFGFRSTDGFGLGWVRSDGAGEIQQLLSGKTVMNPYSFFPDGRRLAYYASDPDGRYDLWTMSLDVTDPEHPKPGPPEPFLRMPPNERHPAVSPDGHWIAYSSDESGRSQVYVRPFPGPGGKWQVSNSGGQLPIWSPNKRELFFQSLDHRIMVADYEGKTDSFVVAKPRLWSDRELHYPSALNYDLAPDGRRFAMFPELDAPQDPNGAIVVNFLENFFDEVRLKAPFSRD